MGLALGEYVRTPAFLLPVCCFALFRDGVWLGRGWFLEFQDQGYKLKKGLVKVVGRRCIRKEKLAVDVYLNTLLKVYNFTRIDILRVLWRCSDS